VAQVEPVQGAPFELNCEIEDLGEQGASCLVPTIERGYRLLGEVPVGYDPEGVVVDVVTDLVYVACSRSNAVAVVDLEKMETITTIPVGREPIDIVIDQPTRRAFTADARSDQVSVIDLDSHQVVAKVDVGSFPAGLAIDEERRRLYCGDTMGCTVSIVDLDSLELLTQVPAELGAGAITVDLTRGRVYCVNFVAASMNVFESDGTPVGRVALGEGTCAVAVSPLINRVFAVNSLDSTISEVDGESLEVLANHRVPNAPVGMFMGAREDRLYVSNRGDGTASILGLEGKEWARVPVGAAPGGVTFHPGRPNLVLVANAGSGSLSVFEDLLEEEPAERPARVVHPLVGKKLPTVSLPDLDGNRHELSEWEGKPYIVNVFASW
jgi:YVTN family beta-propeller protein